MRLYTVLIKPVSGQCNMQCDYCFYCDEMKNRSTASYGRMSEQTLRNVIRRAMRQAGEEICFAFQGGEPTLRGLDFYSRAIELEKRFNTGHTRVLNSIQTNGLALDEEWCRFFREHDFLVGVSLDGTKRCHDTYRHGPGGGGTYRRVTESIKLLEEFGVRFNILTVVTAQTAEHIEEIYGEYRKNGWQYQQYIACLDPIGAGIKTGGAEKLRISVSLRTISGCSTDMRRRRASSAECAACSVSPRRTGAPTRATFMFWMSTGWEITGRTTYGR